MPEVKSAPANNIVQKLAEQHSRLFSSLIGRWMLRSDKDQLKTILSLPSRTIITLSFAGKNVTATRLGLALPPFHHNFCFKNIN